MKMQHMLIFTLGLAIHGPAFSAGAQAAGAPEMPALRFIDMTHEIPTFEPLEQDRTKPDLAAPILHSSPVAGFGPQAILYPPDVFPTNEGHFDSASLLLQEHAGTHINSPNHFLNNEISQEPGGTPVSERQAMHEVPIEQLAGPVVLIDVSGRVSEELRKNNGRPHPDLSVTDFSDSSRATVRAADIDAVADQITEGVWVIANVGWSQFYPNSGEDWETSPYVNRLNHPGFTREAVDRLIEIMEEKQVRVAGIAADSFTTDSGEGAKGTDDQYSHSWPSHVRLYQRGVLSVESLANVGALAAAIDGGETCHIFMGALKHVGGTGSPVRAVAICRSEG